MAERVDLLEAFYRELPSDRAKIESHEHGFGYLGRLRSRGLVLEYGEMSGHALLHKYKVSGVSPAVARELLNEHVASLCNVCRYFRADENGLFCLNLDNNHKVNNTEILPEMRTAILALRKVLRDLRLEPLVIASGRGYHVWVRLAGRVPNPVLYTVMVRSAAIMLAHVQHGGGDSRRLKVNFYPDIRSHDIVSLRLFGSIHAKNRAFSHVLADSGLLSVDDSWKAFENYLHNSTISVDALHQAHETLLAAF